MALCTVTYDWVHAKEMWSHDCSFFFIDIYYTEAEITYETTTRNTFYCAFECVSIEWMKSVGLKVRRSTLLNGL